MNPNFEVHQVAQASSSATHYLRLYPLETRVYISDKGLWMASIFTAPGAMLDLDCSGSSNEIIRLIDRGILIPDIESNKEYEVQRAVGSIDYRTYRLQSKIAAKYQFSYDTKMTLSIIENLIVLCDYNIFDDARGLQVDGQKYLEIIPKDGTKVYDYQGNIITDPTNEMHYVDKFSFDDMVNRGIIVLRGTKWKLSRNYWEFRL